MIASPCPVPRPGRELASPRKQSGHYAERMKSVIVIVAYRPKPGKETELLDLMGNRVPILRKEGLVTDREPIIMRARDGTIIEVSEWKSREAIDAAHRNPNVLAMWEKFLSSAIAFRSTPCRKQKKCSLGSSLSPISSDSSSARGVKQRAFACVSPIKRQFRRRACKKPKHPRRSCDQITAHGARRCRLPGPQSKRFQSQSLLPCSFVILHFVSDKA